MRSMERSKDTGKAPEKGKVFLVGAGPGDIGLLTVKGLRCLQTSDVVVYDFHINAQILSYVSSEAEFVYAGKRGGHHAMTQDEINSVLVQKALEGKTVCRLKGGDPFVFGRGGEEAEVLVGEGIEFEVVPGISSAVAAPAYAGIPLTHRDYSSSFVVVPGNEASTKTESSIDWPVLAGCNGTVVFLMAVKNISTVTERLIQHGKSPDTPVAAICWGTRTDQKTITGRLENIHKIIEDRNVRPPAVIVVGNVVKLRSTLNWFEKRPLLGQRILVTREHSTGFESLEKLGAELLIFPTVRVVPPESWRELDTSIERLSSYRWLIFTSANGVRYFFDRLFELGRDIRELHGLMICAIGTKTASAVRKYGLKVDLIPESFRAEGLIEAFGGSEALNGVRLLLPRAEVAREVFPERIRELGGEIDVPTAYRAVMPRRHAGRLKRFHTDKKITIATFTSAATFNNFCEIMGDDAASMLNGVKIAAIGPVTAKSIETKGLTVQIMPETATVEAMAEAIIESVLKSSE